MTKVFGSLVALDDVSIKVGAGEFHALLGENGAGKSTLVKCMMGFYQPTRGQLLVDDREVVIKAPADGAGRSASAWSISISRSCPRLTAAENLVIARADAPAVIDWAREKEELRPSWNGCRSGFRSTRSGRAVGGREAEARNSQAALSRPALPDPRRADIGADAGRGRRDPRPVARHGARPAT
jgi:ABC-type branched-subunit amino acid transport system ATPase component